MKGGRGLYYRKHMNDTWIRETQKVTKALVVECVSFVYVVTIISIMTIKMIVILILVVITNRVRIENASAK